MTGHLSCQKDLSLLSDDQVTPECRRKLEEAVSKIPGETRDKMLVKQEVRKLLSHWLLFHTSSMHQLLPPFRRTCFSLGWPVAWRTR